MSLSFIQPICQAFTGKKARTLYSEAVCQALSGKEDAEGDEELMAPMMTGQTVIPLAGSKSIVDAEHASGSQQDGMEAQATPPVEFTVKLSQNYPGHQEPINVNGPHGTIEVVPPPEAQPGSSLVYRLAPQPEFRVKVPPGCKPGMTIEIVRPDGVKIGVPVPPGMEQGDSYDVTPPALMVRVPQNAEPGTMLCFKDLKGEWFRARAPEGFKPGRYFAARIPQGRTKN